MTTMRTEGGLRRSIGCLMLVSALAAMAVESQEVVIQSLAGNGVLTWSNTILPGAGCRVEWAPSLDSSWQNSWDNLLDIPATNATTQRPVPMFYRVVSYPLPTQVISNVTAATAFSILTNRFNDTNFMVLDVRTPSSSEYGGGHVKTALNVNFYSSAFQQTLSKLDRKLTYLVYCASGNRSGQATAIMRQLQFMTVYNMTTGYSTLASQSGASGYLE